MSNEDQSAPRSRSFASLVLEDGTIIEMIHRAEKRETALLSFRVGAVTEANTLDLPGIGRVVPYSPENNLLSHGVIAFPSGCDDYESDIVLLGSIRAFIHRYADLSEDFEEVASYYVLLSWLFDSFSELPYLRLKGDYGSGKSRCLQTIGSLCYKPMFVSGASTVSPIFRIIDAFRGTLVLDESDFRFSDERAEITKILNNGNASGFPVLRSEPTPTKEYNPRAFAVFGPKIIATRREFEDRALESRCITEVMSGLPPRSDIPLSLPAIFHTDAEALRNQLLMYRFRNLRQGRDLAVLRDPSTEARVAQVFAPLLSLAQTEQARERMLSFARAQSGALRSDRSASVEADLLTTLFAMRKEQLPLGVRAVTERFREQFSGDYERPITPRWLGGQLRKRLSLLTVKSHGIFVVPETEYAKIDVHIMRYGVGDDTVDVGTSRPF